MDARPRRTIGRDRATLAYWRLFYRDQARLIWEWRAARLALVRRALLSYVAAAAALLIVATASPSLTLSGPSALALAALLLSGLNSVARPILLLALSPLPTIAVQGVGLIVEVGIVLLMGQVVPGVGVGSLEAAVLDAVLLSALNAVFAEILRASDDDSYHGTQVRRLAAREFGRPVTPAPGLLMIQIDGLSLPVLEDQMRAGRMPTLDRLVRGGELRLDPWFPLLPSVTPVSQAGILHGDNDDMPGFRWFEKRSRNLIVANTPDGASEILRSRSNGRGLLADDGASIGNLVTGDAPRSYLTMATIAEDAPADDDPRRLRGIFVSQVNYIRLAVLTIGEIGKELYQRERQRARGIAPRIDRGITYALERALTNVSLRNLTTALVIEEMFSGAPAIYVDYTGYDALAHHVGPERAEAVDALDGLDRTIGSLLKVARETPKPYRFVILSDHGQCLGIPFSQQYGEGLDDAARRLMGDPDRTGDASPIGDRRARLPAWQAREYQATGRIILGELGRGRGARSAVARRAARRAERRAERRAARNGTPIPTGVEDRDLVVCAAGNLAQLYLTCSEGRLDREEIDFRYPNLIGGLLQHPGVAAVSVHSALDGAVVLGRDGRHELATGRVTGVDPLRPFGPLAAESLRRLDGFANTGDLTVIGPYDAATGEVVSYEDLVGSHGGPGGWQGRPFVMHPVDLPIADAPLIGAVAVHDELARWLEALRTGGPLVAAGSTRERPASDTVPDGLAAARAEPAAVRAAGSAPVH